MPHARPERRRSLRAEARPARSSLVLHSSLQVRIVDVGSAGMLLESKAPFAIGDRGEVHALVGSRSVRIQIEVRHVSVEPISSGDFRYRIVAGFSSMSVEERAAIVSLFDGTGE